MNKRKSRGFLLAGTVIMMVVAAILIPVIIKMMKKDSVDSVRASRQIQATNLAAAGLDKVEWRFKYDHAVSSAILAGIVPPGFNDNTVFADIDGGIYKVDVSTAAGTMGDYLTILVRAKENRTGKVKAVQANYRKAAFSSVVTSIAFESGGSSSLSLSTAAQVHWGPIIAESFSTAVPLPEYPRKIARSSFNPQDMSASLPNSGPGWESFRTDLEWESPQPDFGYYKEKAQNSRLPSDTATGSIRKQSANILFYTVPFAEADPPESGYFPGLRNVTTDSSSPCIAFVPKTTGYVFHNSTSVVLISGGGDARVELHTGTFLDVEAIVTMGITSIGRVAVIGPGVGGGVMGATIPVAAPSEYTTVSSLAVWNAGLPSMSLTYSLPGRCCYPVNNIYANALIIGDLQNAAPGVTAVFLGAHIGRSLGGISFPIQMYYNPDKMAVLRNRNPPVRTSYREVNAAW